VNGKCEVYVDGGILSGSDVMIALALGAKAIFLGTLMWALASGVSIFLTVFLTCIQLFLPPRPVAG